MTDHLLSAGPLAAKAIERVPVPGHAAKAGPLNPEFRRWCGPGLGLLRVQLDSNARWAASAPARGRVGVDAVIPSSTKSPATAREWGAVSI